VPIDADTDDPMMGTVSACDEVVEPADDVADKPAIDIDTDCDVVTEP